MPIPAEYRVAINTLIEAIPINEFGEIDCEKLQIKAPWKTVGNETNGMYKVKAQTEELGLFVKFFSLEAINFAQIAALALKELSQLELPVPILGPSFEMENLHGYRLGIVQPQRKILEILQGRDIGKIEEVVQKFGLTSLFSQNFISDLMKVDTVIIDGQPFIIDPIDDSAGSIFRYLSAK